MNRSGMIVAWWGGEPKELGTMFQRDTQSGLAQEEAGTNGPMLLFR